MSRSNIGVPRSLLLFPSAPISLCCNPRRLGHLPSLANLVDPAEQDLSDLSFRLIYTVHYVLLIYTARSALRVSNAKRSREAGFMSQNACRVLTLNHFYRSMILRRVRALLLLLAEERGWLPGLGRYDHDCSVPHQSACSRSTWSH